LALHGYTSCSCLPLLQPLKQLTSLDITSVDAEAGILQGLQGLPASLVRLQLQEFRVLPSYSTEQEAAECFLDLQHLTNLTRLQLDIDGSAVKAQHVTGKLPAQLLELDARSVGCGVVPVLGVTAQQQLQRLILREYEEFKDQGSYLTELVRLSSLTYLEVTTPFVDARAIAGTWAELPQLRSLSLLLRDRDDLPEEGLQELLTRVGQAKSLHRLDL
jgi:hypothetical protein